MDVTATPDDPACPEPHALAQAVEGPPALVPGTQLLGPYQDGAYEQQRYMVRRADGQVLLVSAALYAIISHLDGSSDLAVIADAVSSDLGRTIDTTTLDTVIGSRLRPLGVVAGGDHTTVGARRQLLGLTLRCTLIPERAVRRIARILAPLFHPVLVAYSLVALIGLDIWFFSSQSVIHDLVTVVGDPRLMAALLGIYVGAALFHESGHAAAAVRGGADPGRIGMGIYVVIPAFFTDVSDTYRLDRVGRLRTDLGGVYFNVLLAAVLGAVTAATGSPLAGIGFALTQLAMMEQLLPLVRLDGYFVLSDLVGVPDLFARVRPSVRALLWRRHHEPPAGGLRARAAAIVLAWTLVVYPALLALLVLLFVRLPTVVRTSWRSVRAEWSMELTALAHAHLASAAVLAVGLVALCVPFIGVGILALRSTGSVVRSVIRRL